MKSFLKQLTPPLFLQYYRQIKFAKSQKNNRANDILWGGNYRSWQEASVESIGYSNNEILEKCKTSLLKVKSGEAMYERDSVLFEKVQYSWPLLACLENVAISNKGCLHIIDFGGSLGSSFFQNKLFLQNVVSLKWYVVEQEHFVLCGKKEFEDENLKFEFTIDHVLSMDNINCLLISGVLQYLENPENWVKKLLGYNFDYIIIDRTSFIESSSRLTVQKVPEIIYRASYPCWFFNEKEFLGSFDKSYHLIADFESYADGKVLSEDQKLMYWKGFFLKKKN